VKTRLFIFEKGPDSSLIASILLFVLGFLTAAALALLIVPAVSRRAARLTKRRIEASLPLTSNEIRAEKDRLRAGFAMTTRRLEMEIDALRLQAAEHLVEIGRQQEKALSLARQMSERDGAIAALDKKGETLETELKARADELDQLSSRLADAEQQLETRIAELERMQRAVSDANMDVSNRQIELVARETEIEKLFGDIELLRDEHRQADRHLRETDARRLSAEEALKLERHRNTEMNEKLEKLMALLADREQALEANTREIETLRQRLTEEANRVSGLSGELATARERQAVLEAERADISGRMEELLSGAHADQLERAMEKLDGERKQLEDRLVALEEENGKLRAGRPSAEDEESRREDAALREQISNLAAEVVHLTALVEGPGSPIHKALDKPLPSALNGSIASLGERVRALQKASAMR
jgi:chromosome segregation ATPase